MLSEKQNDAATDASPSYEQAPNGPPWAPRSCTEVAPLTPRSTPSTPLSGRRAQDPRPGTPNSSQIPLNSLSTSSASFTLKIKLKIYDTVRLGRRESLSEAKTLLQKVYFYRLTEKDVSTARRL
jgi:hypothetical protein